MNKFNKKGISIEALEEILTKLGSIAEEKMQKTEDEEQYAFLFGHVNVAAALVAGLQNNVININFNYEESKKAYENTKKVYKSISKKIHQIDMDELFPELLKLLKTIKDKDSDKE